MLLSLHDDEIRRGEARAAGAHAFVGKQEGVTVLLPAIHEAARTASRTARPVEAKTVSLERVRSKFTRLCDAAGTVAGLYSTG